MLFVLVAAQAADALIILGAEDVHRVPPRAREGEAPFEYWNHVVGLGSYSGIYLGKRWVLTAAHVGAREAKLRGERYSADLESEIDLRTDFLPADLVLFRLREDPGLPALSHRNRAAPARSRGALRRVGARGRRGALRVGGQARAPLGPRPADASLGAQRDPPDGDAVAHEGLPHRNLRDAFRRRREDAERSASGAGRFGGARSLSEATRAGGWAG